MERQSYGNPLLISLLFHAVVLAVLVVSLEFRSRNFVFENSQDNHVISAVVLDSAKVQMPDPSSLPKPKVPQPVKKVMPTPPPASVPKTIPKPVVKPAPQPVQQKAIAIPDRHKKQVQKDLIQKQLLADLKKQTEEKKKVTKQTDLEKAFEKELKAQKALAAKAMQQDLLKEKDRAASAQAQKMSGIVDKYKALILQAIGQSWVVPPGANPHLSCELLIRVAAGGNVLDVQIVKSSGDDALDRSARSAVFKASPLPVPSASDEFEPFREFILKVKPENIVTRDNGLS